MSDHVHAFDPVSGWCAFCTVRDDGRQTWHGTPLQRPTTTAQQEEA